MESIKIVVTGRSGSGKSTLLRGLALFAEDLGIPYFAIITPDAREGKRRAGFAIETVDFDPQRATSPTSEETQPAKIKQWKQFARRIQPAGDPAQVRPPEQNQPSEAQPPQSETPAALKRVGYYLVDPSVVGNMIVAPLRARLQAGQNPLIFWDEVGPMHLTHAPLGDALRALLNASTATAFITLADEVDAAIRDEVRAHPSVEMFALTRENRDALLNTFIAHLVDLAAGE